MQVQRSQRRRKRLLDQASIYENKMYKYDKLFEHGGNVRQLNPPFNYHGGFSHGYIMGKVAEIETLLDVLCPDWDDRHVVTVGVV